MFGLSCRSGFSNSGGLPDQRGHPQDLSCAPNNPIWPTGLISRNVRSEFLWHRLAWCFSIALPYEPGTGFVVDPCSAWHAPEYRLPIATFEHKTGFDLRRADLVLAFLLKARVLKRSQLRAPARIDCSDIERVHTSVYLDSITFPKELARIFGVNASEVLTMNCSTPCASPVELLWKPPRKRCAFGGRH